MHCFSKTSFENGRNLKKVITKVVKKFRSVRQMLNATLYRDPWKKYSLIQELFVLSFKLTSKDVGLIY
jgi:hypothetical protein